MIRSVLTIDPATTGTLLEIRLSQFDSAVVEIFWADASGPIAAPRRTTIPSANMIGDGQFHTYQIRFDGVFIGNLTQLRIDPGTTSGRTVIFDYIRIGQTPAVVDPVFTEITYDTVFREATIRWTSTTGRTYTLQATSDPGTPGSWTDLAIDIPGEVGTTSYIDSSTPPALSAASTASSHELHRAAAPGQLPDAALPEKENPTKEGQLQLPRQLVRKRAKQVPQGTGISLPSGEIRPHEAHPDPVPECSSRILPINGPSSLPTKMSGCCQRSCPTTCGKRSGLVQKN